jgi:hypothetical protein
MWGSAVALCLASFVLACAAILWLGLPMIAPHG